MIERPLFHPPTAADNKYTRGLVCVLGGAMPGASRLAARAAMHAGAGYVILATPMVQHGLPDALVTRTLDDPANLLADDRIAALLIGPGLGRDDRARAWLDVVIAGSHPLVLDGDALTLLGTDAAPRIAARAAPTILTPHSGEFDRMFPGTGDKAARTEQAATASRATIVHKGAETVIAGDFATVTSRDASPWLSTAGTGDVLAGLVAARLARRGATPRDAATEAVWLHGRVAALAGSAFIADDLIPLIPGAIAECLTPA